MLAPGSRLLALGTLRGPSLPESQEPRARSLSGSKVALPPLVRIQGILFDIDGTLVDSNDIHARVWVEAFHHFGKTIEFEAVRSHIGKGGDLLVPDLLNAREMRAFGEKLKEYRGDLFKDKYMKTVRPFPRAGENLRILHDRGVRLVLSSSADPEEVEYYSGLLGVEDLLKGTTSKEDAEFSKPSPEIFQAGLKRLKTDPARTLVVGDTPYDILAAHRAALPIAAVLSGGFEREDLEKAEFLFDDVEEFVRKIDTVDEYFND
jgi:HAD superfamily hydrolase (TIGR01509 family)